MFARNIFCFSCLTEKNNLKNVKNYIDGVSYEEKLLFCGLFYKIPSEFQQLLCLECCDNINMIYKFKKEFLEKQELLKSYAKSMQNGRKVKKLSLNVLSCYQYVPETMVHNIDLTEEKKFDETLEEKFEEKFDPKDVVFDLTLDDENEEETTPDLPNPFTTDIVKEDVETNEMLEVVVKTEEDQQENYEIEQENNNGLKIVIKKSDKQKFECVFCMKIFYNLNNLKMHEKSHPKFDIPCQICGKVLKTKVSYQIHMSQHTGDYKYHCNICNKGITTKQNLQVHKQSHLKKMTTEKKKRGRPKKISGNPENFCKICNYKFVCKQALTKHNFRFHTPRNCEKCDETFGSKLDMQNHACQNEKIYCEKCDLYFSNSTNFNNHVENSHKEHKCQHCLTIFKNKISLRHHQKKNCQQTKTEAYKCENCDRTFMNKLQLDTHMLIHSGVFNYQCNYCPNMFSTNDQLQTHITRMHKTKFFSCKVCLKTFKSYRYFKQHNVRNHSNFAPTFHCDFCVKTFTTFRQLRNHKNTHTSREKCFKCSECDKVFFQKHGLIRHLVTHTNERNHICKYCGKKFNLGPILIRHIKAFHEDDEEFEKIIES